MLNKRTVESLIKSGAFDSLGHPRKGLCLVFEQVIDRFLARRRERELGVMSLFSFDSDEGGGDGDDGAGSPAFDDARVPVPDLEFDKAQKLAFEKEMLGLYISDHPLLGVEASLRRITDGSIAELRELRDGEIRTVGGVVTGLSRKYTKKGDLMATFFLEDLQSAIECWVFPRAMHEYGPLLVDDAIVCVKARLDTRDEQPKLTALEIRRPELNAGDNTEVHLEVPLGSLTESRVTQLKQLLVEHPGPSPVFLHVGRKVLRLTDDFGVDAGNGFMGEIRVLLGPNAVLG